MLLKTVVLGLSTCASALNARSDSAGNIRSGNDIWNTATKPLAVSSNSVSSESSSLPSIYSSVASSYSSVISTAQPTTKNPIIPPYPTKSQSTSSPSAPSPTGISESCAPYWLENIKHQGLASFNPNPDNYTVYRNVKDFGARGDGVTDDTSAIQRAVTQGNRCGPSSCESSTNTPAIVYFPEGTYLISSSIIDYYYTQVCRPIATSLG